MAYGMSDRKRNPPRPGESDQEQSERFERTARELGVELDEDKLKEALRADGEAAARKGRGR